MAIGRGLLSGVVPQRAQINLLAMYTIASGAYAPYQMIWLEQVGFKATLRGTTAFPLYCQVRLMTEI